MNNDLKFLQRYNDTQQLIQAIEQRNVAGVDLVCKKLRIERSDLIKTLGDEWIIQLSSKEALDWFWLLLMEPEEYRQMISGLIGQAIKVL